MWLTWYRPVSELPTGTVTFLNLGLAACEEFAGGSDDVLAEGRRLSSDAAADFAIG